MFFSKKSEYFGSKYSLDLIREIIIGVLYNDFAIWQANIFTSSDCVTAIK